ncbi:MAG: IS110 family transposase [Gammaproteobacteria bacterium]
MNIQTLGIDLGKDTFHVVGLDAQGRPVLRRRFSRTQLRRWTANLPPCLIGMEACGGAHHLGHGLASYGHTVRLMPAQYVKPYLKTNKSDFLDAEAIAEAVTRPSMRFVPLKTVVQQELQAQHRLRSLGVRQRTATVNQARALLLEQGLTIPKMIGNFRRQLPRILEDAENGLSPCLRALVADLFQQVREFDARIDRLTQDLTARAQTEPACQRLMTVPGIGPLIATAMVAAVGNGQGFRRGRHFAAWLGLVPRQYSTGGKPKLLGISKRGNRYLRMLLVHGARSVLRRAPQRQDELGHWLQRLSTHAHPNVVTVALANKTARVAWAVLTGESPWCAQRAAASCAL